MNTPFGQGYTIVETMIVLAVSSLMFVIAVTAFNGRQQQIAFTQSVRDFDSRLQDYINDVSSGYYENSGDMTCTAPPTGAGQPTITVSPEAQGASDDCIALGKVLQFQPHISGSDDANSYVIYQLIGRRVTSSGDPVNNLAEAKPQAAVVTTPISNVDQKALVTKLDNGLKVTRVFDKGSGVGVGTDVGAIAFVTSFSSSIGNVEQSNGNSVRHAGVRNVGFGETRIGTVGNLKTLTDDGSGSPDDLNLRNSVANNEIIICLEDPSNASRKAAIAIGAGGGATTTEVQMDSYDAGICV